MQVSKIMPAPQRIASYIEKRDTQGEHLTYFFCMPLGYSKTEKMAAARALFSLTNTPYTAQDLKALASQHPALKQGRLGKIYEKLKTDGPHQNPLASSKNPAADQVENVQNSSSDQPSADTIDNLLQGLYLTQHGESFDKADQLVEAGAALPELNQPPSKFSSKRDFFKHLSSDYRDLYIALKKTPGIITEQDEQGHTILHHAATIGMIMGSDSASLIYQVLFKAPGVDFNQQNKDGNTPVHTAGIYSSDMVTCNYVFPTFLEEAIFRGFDCSTRNLQGLTVLHLAAIKTYANPCMPTPPVKNVSTMLGILIKNKIPNLPKVLNCLSKSGSTAFFYALNRGRLAEAEELLNAGADPARYGKKDRNPLGQIEKSINSIQKEKQNIAVELESLGVPETLIDSMPTPSEFITPSEGLEQLTALYTQNKELLKKYEVRRQIATYKKFDSEQQKLLHLKQLIQNTTKVADTTKDKTLD